MTYDQALAEQEYRRTQYDHFSLQNIALINLVLLLIVGIGVYLV